METSITVTKFDDSITLFQKYKDVFNQIASERYLPKQNDNSAVFDINPEIGEGTIQLYALLGGLLLIVYDMKMKDEYITKFDLSSEYFEIEYCIDGTMELNEVSSGISHITANDLSVSLSQNMKGEITRRAGDFYQGISITSEKAKLSNYLGSVGMDGWNESIERMEHESRHDYYLGIKTGAELKNAFLGIFNCRLPNHSRSLFYESKIMEIFALVITGAVVESEDYELVSLSEYELAKIKEIPDLLLASPFELPSLEELSKELIISPKKLSSGFKSVYGNTIFEYHRKQILSRAQRLLLTTDMAVSELAYECGYSSPSNFCAAFKKEFGTTPKKYRESSILRK